jgi:hypothetical protein
MTNEMKNTNAIITNFLTTKIAGQKMSALSLGHATFMSKAVTIRSTKSEVQNLKKRGI